MADRGFFDFVGVFAAMPANRPIGEIRATIEDFIKLTSKQPWGRIEYDSKGTTRHRRVRYSEKNMARLMELLNRRELHGLHLSGLMPDDMEWQRTYTEFSSFDVFLHFEFQHLPGGRVSSVPPPCTFVLTFPIDLFQVGKETEFQSTLLRDLTYTFETRSLSYCFVNRGRRAYMPGSVGVDDLFWETVKSVPIMAYDYDLWVHTTNIYEDMVRGALWANFLNAKHVAKLGGWEAIASRMRDSGRPSSPGVTGSESAAIVPVWIVRSLASGGALIVVSPSPFDSSSEVEKSYQALLSFLAPVLPADFEAQIYRHRQSAATVRRISERLGNVGKQSQ